MDANSVRALNAWYESRGFVPVVGDIRTFIGRFTRDDATPLSSKRSRRKIPFVTVKYLMWGQDYKCACGDQCSTASLPPDFEINHVHPHALGGSDDPGNLVLLCRNCHGAYTNIHCRWINIAQSVRKRLDSQHVCIGCHRVVSTYFAEHNCSEEHTWKWFPKRPNKASIRHLRTRWGL